MFEHSSHSFAPCSTGRYCSAPCVACPEEIPSNSLEQSIALVSPWFPPVRLRTPQDRLRCTPFARAMVSVQAALFFPLLLVARYGLVLQGIKTVGWEWHKRHTGFGSPRGAVNWTRVAEAVGYGCYFGYVGVLVGRMPNWVERVLFVLISHAAFSIMHLQVTELPPSTAPHLALRAAPLILRIVFW